MNDSMWNKTATYDGKIVFLLFQLLKIHIFSSGIFEETKKINKSEYSTFPLFYQLIFDMTFGLEEQQ